MRCLSVFPYTKHVHDFQIQKFESGSKFCNVVLSLCLWEGPVIQGGVRKIMPGLAGEIGLSLTGPTLGKSFTSIGLSIDRRAKTSPVLPRLGGLQGSQFLVIYPFPISDFRVIELAAMDSKV